MNKMIKITFHKKRYFVLDKFDCSDSLFNQWFIPEVSLHISDLIDDVDAAGDLAEGSILTVKMRSILMHDEELR